MNNIVIFKSITTNEVLAELEAESKKYEGLHVDMENKDERKFVKDKASLVSGMLKKLDRARIDESASYKLKVEAEALDIKERLEIINLPFTLLIDKHKAERAKILAEEKAIAKAKELAIQKELDHEDAIMHNKVFDMEARELKAKLEAEKESARLQYIAESEKKAKEDAEKAQAQAKQDLIDAENKRLHDIEQEKQRAIASENARIQQEEKAKQDAINAENKRIADVEQAKQDEINKQNAIIAKQKADEEERLSNQAHVTAVCKGAKESLMQFAGLTEEQAVNAVKAIISNQVLNVEIKF